MTLLLLPIAAVVESWHPAMTLLLVKGRNLLSCMRGPAADCPAAAAAAAAQPRRHTRAVFPVVSGYLEFKPPIVRLCRRSLCLSQIGL